MTSRGRDLDARLMIAALSWAGLVQCTESEVRAPCEEGVITCDGSTALVCRGGREVLHEACDDLCTPGVGCTCTPGRLRCVGPALEECGEGNEWTVREVADEEVGEACRDEGSPRIFTDCELAELRPTNEGCTFWPTVTPNAARRSAHSTPASWDAAHFAVVVTNPHDTTVDVSIDRGGIPARDASIAPRSVEVITLPWVRPLLNGAVVQTVPAGAYRMVTSRPVAAVQINPLEPTLPPDEYTRSNEASLLLPQASLGTRYRVLSFGTTGSYRVPELALTEGAPPGFAAITATENDTRVEVRFAGFTGLLRDGTVGHARGDTAVVTLDAGDVYLVVSPSRPRTPPPDPIDAHCSAPDAGGTRECRFDRRYDLTGTEIVADRPVAVFGGHACALVGRDPIMPSGYRQGCDHLEAQLLPVEALGRDAIGATIWSPRDEYPNLWRIASASDGPNEITFDPPVHPPTRLEAGEHLDVEHRGPLHVRGTDRLVMAQLLPGSNSNTRDPIGDPSLAIMPSTDRLREDHHFLVAPGWPENTLQVILPMGTGRFELDGAAITPTLIPIGDSGLGYTNVEIAPGPHTLHAPGAPAAILVLSIAPHSSLLY